MAIPTDRGYAILNVDEAGATTVSVSVTPPDHGASEYVFAVHAKLPEVAVDKSLKLARAGNVAWSTVPVQVFVDQAGLVHVAPLAAKQFMATGKASGAPVKG